MDSVLVLKGFVELVSGLSWGKGIFLFQELALWQS
jgi:hypothetical protein